MVCAQLIDIVLYCRAASALWADSLFEYFNVDTSASMNDLASLVLKDGKEENEIPLKGVFYRQFLPASQTVGSLSILCITSMPLLHFTVCISNSYVLIK